MLRPGFTILDHPLGATIRGPRGGGGEALQISYTSRAVPATPKVSKFPPATITDAEGKGFSQSGDQIESQVCFPLLQNNPGNFVAGNICKFVKNWMNITKVPWVLDNVKGIVIPFNELPVQAVAPFPFKLTADELLPMDSEISRLHVKKVREATVLTDSENLSNIFLRPEPNGEYRLILDLSNLNHSVEYNHFKMFSLKTALEMMTSNAWLL